MITSVIIHNKVSHHFERACESLDFRILDIEPLKNSSVYTIDPPESGKNDLSEREAYFELGMLTNEFFYNR
jgi:hypothetical protein